MRRPRIVTTAALVALSAALLSSVGVASASASAPVAPRASLTAIGCRSTVAPRLRRVSVVTVMRHRPGTRSLQVRVELLQTAPGGVTHAVQGGDLGRWVSPAVPTLGREPDDVWRLAKAVYDVGAPARYRFEVEFRWLGAGGRVIADQTLSTGSCAVRPMTPDVLVRSVAVIPLSTGVSAGVPEDRYIAQIGNRGGSASGPFSVLFAPGAGEPSQTRPVGSLRAGGHTRVVFVGPACDAAAPPTVVADPFDQVDDSDRANNTFTVTCPE